MFWQYSATGSVGGISTDVDLDVFDGSPAQLDDWAYHTLGECSGTCLVAQTGETVVEEDASCACGEGALTSIEGHDGHAYTTVVDQTATTIDDGVDWPLRFERGGTYDVSVWVPDADNLTSGAVVSVLHNGVTDTVTADQTTLSSGWLFVGTFHFAASGTQSIRIGDGTDDSGNIGTTAAIDAISLTPADDGDCACEGDESETQDCSDETVRTRDCDGCEWTAWSECTGTAQILEPKGCGCESGSGTLAAVALGMAVGVVAGRRRTIPG